MKEQQGPPNAEGLEGKSATPATNFVKDRQILTGSATAGEPQGTPEASGQTAAAGGGTAGKTSPAPAASAPSETQIVDAVNKLGERVEAMGGFITKLASKQDQTRKDMEARFGRIEAGSQRGGTEEGGEGEPPQVDGTKIAEQVTQQVMQTMAPLIRQTATNATDMKIRDAMQSDPEVAKMVESLPEHVRANLGAHVQKLAGERLFREPTTWEEAMEHHPVRDAVELLYYRSAGQRRAPQATQTQANEGGQQPAEAGGTFAPVPNTGTHSQEGAVDDQRKASEEFFGTKTTPGNRMHYPPGIARELGIE